ncbi:hypothetical protein BG011_003514, partial [Mortierella polycephala]
KDLARSALISAEEIIGDDETGQITNALFLTTISTVPEPPNDVSHFVPHVEYDLTLYGDWLQTAKAEGSWVNGKESFVRCNGNVETEYETGDEDRAAPSAMQIRVVETDGPEFYISPVRCITRYDIDIDPDSSDQKPTQLITLMNKHKGRSTKGFKSVRTHEWLAGRDQLEVELRRNPQTAL